MAKCLLHRYDGLDNLTSVGVFSSLFQLFKWILGNDLIDWEPTFFVELNQPWNKDLWIGVAFTTANYSPICHQDVLAKVKVLNFTRWRQQNGFTIQTGTLNGVLDHVAIARGINGIVDIAI